MTSEPEVDIYEFESRMRDNGTILLAGVDEAGRGPLAGPVVAAAVLMPPGCRIEGVTDSKRLTAAARERLCGQIRKQATSVGIGIVEHTVIDAVNILNATFLAMNKAVAALRPEPEHLLIDGNRYLTGARIPFTTVVGGDARCFSIAAASIVAKVTRDAIMRNMDDLYPGYGFGKHKGYPTQEHREAIVRLGISPIHRRSFSLLAHRG
jgi:ribonuclease HII